MTGTGDGPGRPMGSADGRDDGAGAGERARTDADIGSGMAGGDDATNGVEPVERSALVGAAGRRCCRNRGRRGAGRRGGGCRSGRRRLCLAHDEPTWARDRALGDDPEHSRADHELDGTTRLDGTDDDGHDAITARNPGGGCGLAGAADDADDVRAEPHQVRAVAVAILGGVHPSGRGSAGLRRGVRSTDRGVLGHRRGVLRFLHAAVDRWLRGDPERGVDLPRNPHAERRSGHELGLRRERRPLLLIVRWHVHDRMAAHGVTGRGK